MDARLVLFLVFVFLAVLKDSSSSVAAESSSSYSCSYSSANASSTTHETKTTRNVRKKRQLTFPSGSNFITTAAVVKPIPTKLPSAWNLLLEMDVVWPIVPKKEEPKAKPSMGKPGRRPQMGKHHRRRRQRRDLYSNFELALDKQGFPGNQCVLRSICEAKFALNPPGVSLVEDLLRVVLSNDSSSSDIYDVAFRTQSDCDSAFPCPFSILSAILHFKDVGNYDGTGENKI
ncbi:uncharacterized protein LOC106653594 [Trichogramma pretiosum]|uniref:uncharacterized protein LOC106653594 n=1 Tax=Trichogramma pretiosum TaxID=7493 RepID=UPI000C718B7D|nr:uncharacterized protein LOC106653594 [Trichogramma pretiosum]